MKSENQINANLQMKKVLWLSGQNRSEKLKEHIRMLDWVVNEGLIRDIDEIMSEQYATKE